MILDEEQISCKLLRMAYEIWEQNSQEKELVLVGIERGGKILADNLAAIVRDISPISVLVVPLRIDKKRPLEKPPETGHDLTDKTVILVDDVVNSGKTMFYALGALIGFDMKKLTVAVLVDRKHKSFPVASDIVGHSIATTLQNHIEVETDGNLIMAVYLE